MTDRALDILRARIELAEKGTAYAREVLARHVRRKGGAWR